MVIGEREYSGEQYDTRFAQRLLNHPNSRVFEHSTALVSTGQAYDIDENRYGFRVPGLVTSPYARAGYVDHEQLSHDAPACSFHNSHNFHSFQVFHHGSLGHRHARCANTRHALTRVSEARAHHC